MVGQNSEIGRESVRIADAFGETVVQLAARGGWIAQHVEHLPAQRLAQRLAQQGN